MGAERSPGRVTIDEWRTLLRESHDVKYEYIDGYVHAMAGGTQAHARIAGNVLGVLDAILGDGPCIAYPLDMATRLSESRYAFPDVVVTCEEYESVALREETEIASPTVVFEVLSESTELYDRTVKSAYYRACPSLREYVLIGTDFQAVEVYRRAADGWGMFHVYRHEDEVELTSINVRFPVAALYRRTNVPATPPDGPQNHLH